MNTPVSFEIAKLLQEKGFEGNYFHYWNMVNHSGEWKLDTRIWEHTDDYIEAPTISDVVMWLYEKHGIWIACNLDLSNSQLFDYRLQKKNYLKLSEIDYNSPTEAYEAAILYTLSNLI